MEEILRCLTHNNTTQEEAAWLMTSHWRHFEEPKENLDITIEGSEKVGSGRQLNRTLLAWAASALPLSHNSQTNALFRVRKNTQHGFFPDGENFSQSSDSTYWVAARCANEAFSTTPAIHSSRGLWRLVVVRLSWLSGRALVAEARCVYWVRPLVTAGLFSFLYFAW